MAVEAGSRFLGEALTVLLRDEGVETLAAGNGSGALADVVVLQVEGEPDESLGATVRTVRASYPNAGILLLACGPSAEWDSAVTALGVAGWLSCEAPCSRVATAVVEVHRHGSLRRDLNDRLAMRQEENGLADLLSQVTTREGEILGLLVDGQSTDEIAEELAISPQTVRAHVQNLMAKLGAHSRVQVVRQARQAGMTPSSLVTGGRQ